MFEAVARLAEDPQALVAARLKSISVLHSFVMPSLGFASRDLLAPETGPTWNPVSSSNHDRRDQTSEVLGAKSEVIAILTRIRAQTSDPMVRNAAEQHLRLLSY